MSLTREMPWLAVMVATALASIAQAAPTVATKAPDFTPQEGTTLKQLPMPHIRQKLPPTQEEQQYLLPPTHKVRTDLMTPAQLKTYKKQAAQQTSRSIKPQATTPDCQDMNKLASYSGSALADYIVNLPDYECHYGLFSLSASQAATIYSPSNFAAVASRFVTEAGNYNASNMALVNLLIYLRAGYYLADGGTISAPSSSLVTTLRPAIKQLIDGTTLYKANPAGPSTANETMTLITNMHDEANYLPDVKAIIQRYTNTSANPNASAALANDTTAGAFTGALTVMFYAHSRTDAQSTVQNDTSYPTALYNFVVNDKAALINGYYAYELSDALNEALRFMQYPAQFSTVQPMVKNILATTSMTGTDSSLWLDAAQAVSFYDSANCSAYGTCNYQTTLANALLTHNYTCSPTIRIRSQELTTDQLQQSCSLVQAEETYFHQMLQTKSVPVKDDGDTSLEIVVWDDDANYVKYAGPIFGIDTNNGGIYLEGEPNQAGNQSRFIAYEADWLRPVFQVWNLQHEYIHYLDGRFDMYGDFATGTSQPTVWWIEGLAEYLSKRNDNQDAIDAAKKGTYKLSQIFQNTYDMADYVNRAYSWGYMAVRFMNERHRADIDAILPKFRAGDYAGYEAYMQQIGTRYDSEFAAWVQAATTAGQPPLPGSGSTGNPTLPTCTGSTSYLGKGCSINNFASNSQSYAYIMLPAGAKNLKLWTSGGSGDVDLYVANNRYPSTTSYDVASATTGNNETVSIPSPVAGRWYYIMMKAKQPFSGVSINATYDQ